MEKVTKNKFSNSIKWKSMNLLCTKGLSMLISIILARSISPKHYGLMTIWAAILAFGNVLVIGGMDTVLIQDKSLNKDGWSTAFFLCLARAFILFFLLFILAPFISDYYGLSELKVLIRISSIAFFCQPFIMLGLVKAARNMSHKCLFKADLLATIVGGVIAWLCVRSELVTYALIANNIIHQIVFAIILFYTIKDKIKFLFIRPMIFSYIFKGSKVISNNILDLLTSFITSLFMGKRWLTVDIGYYNRGSSLTQIVGVESYNVISSVLLPTFASYQADKAHLKTVVRKMISFTSYLMFPMMFGLAVCAENIIVFLFTEKWILAVPYFQISCIYYAMNPFRQLSVNLNYSLGKFKKNNIIETIRFVLNLLLVLFLHYNKNASLKVLAIGGAVISIAIMLMYIISIMKELDYHLFECFNDIVPSLILTVLALLPSLGIMMLNLSPAVSIAFCVISSALTYAVLSITLKLEIFIYLMKSIFNYIGIKKGNE